MKITLIILIVLVLGGLFIARELNTNFHDFKQAWIFTKAYGDWVYHSSLNVKNIIAYAVNLSWKPSLPLNESMNETNLTNQTAGNLTIGNVSVVENVSGNVSEVGNISS